jgi:hypothetical protein
MVAEQPEWPSLDEQLAAAHAIPGSALDHLIRDNQDFQLLRPEEAKDEFHLPPWLRVYWRKNHPDLQISAVDPLGAYPDTLFDIYAWMLKNQDLPWGPPANPTGTKEGTP